MIDTAIIKIKAGDGGDGRSSLRHMKYIEKGGPDGGDGGYGGDVYLVADENLATMSDFRSKSLFEAQSGQVGGANNMSGFAGEDLHIKVPVGTLVYQVSNDPTHGDILVTDFIKSGQSVLIGQGGSGGKGNYRFRSSTNRTPMQFTRGGAGEEKTLRLEMKLIADVGLVGIPNAGKSTLINHLTNANAKIGNYPFTTLEPNLGVCKLKNGKSVVLADIPGLIEGASLGKGLGDDFLRHIERTKVLVILIDPYGDGDVTDFSEKAVEIYKLLVKELADFGRDIDKKAKIVVINKLDITEVNEALSDIKKAFKKLKVEVVGISAVTGDGLDILKKAIMDKLEVFDATPQEVLASQKPVKLYNISNLPNKRVVFGNVSVVETRL